MVPAAFVRCFSVLCISGSDPLQPLIRTANLRARWDAWVGDCVTCQVATLPLSCSLPRKIADFASRRRLHDAWPLLVTAEPIQTQGERSPTQDILCRLFEPLDRSRSRDWCRVLPSAITRTFTRSGMVCGHICSALSFSRCASLCEPHQRLRQQSGARKIYELPGGMMTKYTKVNPINSCVSAALMRVATKLVCLCLHDCLVGFFFRFLFLACAVSFFCCFSKTFSPRMVPHLLRVPKRATSVSDPAVCLYRSNHSQTRRVSPEYASPECPSNAKPQNFRGVDNLSVSYNQH